SRHRQEQGNTSYCRGPTNADAGQECAGGWLPRFHVSSPPGRQGGGGSVWHHPRRRLFSHLPQLLDEAVFIRPQGFHLGEVAVELRDLRKHLSNQGVQGRGGTVKAEHTTPQATRPDA